MSDDSPVFAVVGRINKGKSSIVSTLVEDETVRIDPLPGTTRFCQRFDVRVEGRVLLTVVDTPGFEDAPRVLRWLQERERSAVSRPDILAEFVRRFRDSAEFAEECRLLEPILAGSGILYVVDAAKPYRQNYDAEMEILQWTGRPRMALINSIGSPTHNDEWRRALDQYFSIVRVFDAHHSYFEDRVALLRAFRELREDSRVRLGLVIEEMERDWELRHKRAAGVIAELLIAGLTHCEERPLREHETLPTNARLWVDSFCEALRERERRERAAIEELYRHDRVVREEADFESPVFERDLFAETGWRVLGLDTWQLLRVGVLGGAAVGGAIDLAVGGASLLAGTLIGGAVGGASSYLGARSIARVRVFGRPLGGKVARVGPVKSENFPWILLDRALLHYASVVRRPHACRDPLVLAHEKGGVGARGPASGLAPALRDRFAQLFAKIRAHPGAVARDLHDALEDALLEVMGSGQISPSGRDLT